MNMLAIPPRLISTLTMAVVKQNWRLSPTTAHVPTNLAIHGECDVDESDEDEGDDIYIMMKCVSVCNEK